MSGLEKAIANLKGKAYVEAPAGFGKTHLIASATKLSNCKVLILTHTYAGVRSIKSKLNKVGAAANQYEVSTLDSWSLRLCLAYPHNSGWSKEFPENKTDWNSLKLAICRLLAKKFLKQVLEASYGLVIVDEYQDCNHLQHRLTLQLSQILPCCIIGDPLQGIFGFAGEPIDWETDIYPTFKKLGDLQTPWRWKETGDPQLGTWLMSIREKLKQGDKIDLSSNTPPSVKFIKVDHVDAISKVQITTCKYFKTKRGEKVIAIFDGLSGHKRYTLAKNTSARFSAIEEVEGKRLTKFIRSYSGATSNQEKLLLAIDMAKLCMNKVSANLSAATKRGEAVKVGKSTKNPEIAIAANNFLKNADSNNLKVFLTAISSLKEVGVFSRDLYNRLFSVLDTHKQNPDLSLEDSRKVYQQKFRHSGRPLKFSKLIGTTLLVKGLEYDHAIVLDATSLDTKQLYVALSRASKSLTVISTSPLLPVEI